MTNATPTLRPRHQTRYEVALTGPNGERFAVAYTARYSRSGLLAVVVRHADEIAGAAGTRDVLDVIRVHTRWTVRIAGGWTVGFSGRTEREAYYSLDMENLL
jgi:hypothetical protein